MASIRKVEARTLDRRRPDEVLLLVTGLTCCQYEKHS